MTDGQVNGREAAAERPEGKSEFTEFQKVEYEQIAEAHFRALEAISFFFRYYLLIMSLPLTILAVLFGIAGRGSDFDKSAVSLIGLMAPLFVIVGVIGFCMMMYIINIKMDVVLYSRVVNSIRKFFYDLHDADHSNKLLMRQLPQSSSVPSYRDLPFGFVVFAFALFDTLYLALGSHLTFATQVKGASSVQNLGFGDYGRWQIAIFAGCLGVALMGHFLAYYIFSKHREFSYLRATAIGIDIDGVLNRHREKFCEMADTKLGKKIDPEQIKVLPVHDNVALAGLITREDERAIFNDPQYWVTMPVLEGAGDTIRTIRNSYLLPVHIFTHRPWPDRTVRGGASRADVRALRRLWRNAADTVARTANVKECVRWWINLVSMISSRMPIYYITKYWLRENGIEFDSLLVERGNENIVYARGRYENRFNYAKRKKIRFFVEDDWVKAVKLSYICDIVFLIDHPYNRGESGDAMRHQNETIIGRLPTNVLRVQSWNDLKKLIAQLV